MSESINDEIRKARTHYIEFLEKNLTKREILNLISEGEYHIQNEEGIIIFKCSARGRF